MNDIILILIFVYIIFIFVTPIEHLIDSIAQRRANEVGISFGAIRSWGAVGFALSSLIVGELLSHIGIQYMIWPYLFFGLIAFLEIGRASCREGVWKGSAADEEEAYAGL